MRGGPRRSLSTFAGLALVVALTGCSNGTWRLWEGTSTSATPTSSTATAAPPRERTIEYTPPTTPSAKTAHPAAAVDAEAAVPQVRPDVAERPAVDVRFRPGQLSLARADQKSLDSLVRWLRANPAATITIEGHTDDLGPREVNLVTAEKRAGAVKSYLMTAGIDARRIAIAPVGPDRPLCMEKTDACRAKNRRAHILVSQP